MTCDYHRPGAPDPHARNPLAGPDEHYCPVCGGNLRDTQDGVVVIRPCPLECDATSCEGAAS